MLPKKNDVFIDMRVDMHVEHVDMRTTSATHCCKALVETVNNSTGSSTHMRSARRRRCRCTDDAHARTQGSSCLYFAALAAIQLKDFVTAPKALLSGKTMLAHHIVVIVAASCAELLTAERGSFLPLAGFSGASDGESRSLMPT